MFTSRHASGKCPNNFNTAATPPSPYLFLEHKRCACKNKRLAYCLETIETMFINAASYQYFPNALIEKWNLSWILSDLDMFRRSSFTSEVESWHNLNFKWCNFLWFHAYPVPIKMSPTVSCWPLWYVTISPLSPLTRVRPSSANLRRTCKHKQITSRKVCWLLALAPGLVYACLSQVIGYSEAQHT